MGIRERVEVFFKTRDLGRQIDRVDSVLQRVEESGKVTPTQLNFLRAQDDLIDPDSPEQEYWNKEADEAFEDPSGEKLQDLLEELPLSSLVLLTQSLREELEERRNKLE